MRSFPKVTHTLSRQILLKECGFTIVGTLQKAFNHNEKGFVDAFVMYQWLSKDSE